ncbi:MAG: CHAT domain-containing tetratricopeptide repeat protein [Planctomycetota bacterium]
MLTATVFAVGVLHTPARAEDAPPGPAPVPAPEVERGAALQRAGVLDDQAQALRVQGKPAEAIAAARQSLAIREEALGPDHPDVATSLNALAELLYERANSAEARPLLERALAIRERVLGRDHADLAPVLNNLATLLADAGEHAAARALYERALTIFERTAGTEHLFVGQCLNDLATLLRDQGAYAEAKPMLERALAIYEKVLGQGHPRVASVLSNLAGVLREQGAYAQAGPLFERALAIREKTLGREHPSVAKSLNALAVLRFDQGRYAEAGVLHERALAVFERALGKDHPAVASSLGNLAVLRTADGAYADARVLYERALAIVERARGKDHSEVAAILLGLASVLRIQGGDAEARPLLERALAIDERALGPAHPYVASCLDALAAVHFDEGDYAGARELFERALSIREAALGKAHPSVATNLGNIAATFHAQRAHTEAKALFERALAILEKALGPEHPAVANGFQNLAESLRAQGSYAEATALYGRALAIDERALGKDHPKVAVTLNNLAALHSNQRAFAQARPLYERVLAIDETHARTQFWALNAMQRLALVRLTRHHLDNWIRFTREAGLSGHAEALRIRGMVSRAEAAERALVRRATGEQRAALSSLQAATRLAARLANEPPAGRDPVARAAWQERYATAAAERERLTRQLSSQFASARAELERLDLAEADVRRALPADGALVDLLRVGDGYVAWVLGAAGDTVRVEVGAADGIDAACEAFVTAITDDVGDEPSREAIAKAGAALHALVWAPLRGKLGAGVRRVALCLDAALASVPFAALPGSEPNTYLGDELELSHVSHPFDLVPRAGERHGTGALVVGGVDYDRADPGSTKAPLPERPAELASLDRAPRGGTFVRIPATRVEAEGLRERFGAASTTLLLGADGTEGRLREGVKGKRFVHVATHGFVRTDLRAGLYDRKIKEAFLSADAERQLSVGHDPMLLSGLAMAGANPRDGAGGDDGILTALEASYLDLDGVDLVTLSACETARGTPESGEGVLGLVAAFQMAGARSVLASLWKVDDAATQRLMDDLYRRMLREEAPRSPAEALREAARALRTATDGSGKARYAAPRYWAAFVAYTG